MTDIFVDWKVSVIVEYDQNTFAIDILDGKLQDDRYKMVEGLVLYKDWVYLVLGSKMKGRNWRACHDTLSFKVL